MSRPTAAEQALQHAQLVKAVSTYSQIITVMDALDGVIMAEASRFGIDSPVAVQLVEVSKALANAKEQASERCR